MKYTIWQQKIIDIEKSFSNKKLFDRVMALMVIISAVNLHNGFQQKFSKRKCWECGYLYLKLKKRLSEWLTK